MKPDPRTETKLQLIEVQAQAELENDKLPEEVRRLAVTTLAIIRGELAEYKLSSIKRQLEALQASVERSGGTDPYSTLLVSATARALEALSLSGGDNRRVFRYFPEIDDVEGPDPREPGKIIRGQMRCGYGTSMYEFHYEYPIEGIGVKKDLIKVVKADGSRVPLFDWCRENNVVVLCNRCGKVITYEVSFDCPGGRFAR